MRITEGLIASRNLADLQRANTAMAKASQQVSTGNRILKPSDDPQGTQQALGENSRDVQRLYVSQGILATDITQSDPGLTGRGVHSAGAVEAFGGAVAPQYIYLVDRNGYVVLRYALTQDPKFILIDLRHLLGASEG